MASPIEAFTQKINWTLIAQQEETFVWQKTTDAQCYSSGKHGVIPLFKEGRKDIQLYMTFNLQKSMTFSYINAAEDKWYYCCAYRNTTEGRDRHKDAVMLQTFLFSLFEEAKTWLNELNEGTITSWNEMREAFISRYFSLVRFRHLLNDIHSFHQLGHETLVDTRLYLKEILSACYGHDLTKGMILKIFHRGLDDPTQGILDAEGIFLYETPNEALKILEDKVLLKLDFSVESQIIPKPKTIISAGGSNINPDHTILVDKFEALATKIDSEFLIIRKELNEMRDSHAIKPIPTMPNSNLISSNSPTISPFLKDCTVHIPYMNGKTFTDDVLSNHVGDKELKLIDGVGTGRMTKKEIKKDGNDMGMPKELNKEWKLNEKVVHHNKEFYHYLWHPTEISHLNRVIK
nr:reverse transcriptase domain-containing protein [Tanacetum cinerariifolium]